MRATARIFIVWFVLGVSGAAWAQDTPTDDPPKEAQGESDADKTTEKKADPTEKTTEETDSPPSVESLGVSDPDDIKQYEAAIQSRMDAWQALESEKQTLNDSRKRRLGARDALISQLDIKLPKKLAATVSKNVVEAEVDIAMADARLVVMDLQVESYQREVDILTVRKEETVDRLKKASVQREKAVEVEKDAIAALAEARQAESAATTEAMKALATKERELAERLVELAKIRKTDLAKTKEEVESGLAVLNETETALSTQREAAFDLTLPDKRSAALDPVFQELVIERRTSRTSRDEQQKTVRQTEARLETLESEMVEAKSATVEERLRYKENETALNEQRFKVAELKQKVLEQEIAIEKERLQAQQDYLKGLREHIDVSTEEIEKSIPAVSSKVRSRYFELSDVQNWRDAFESLQEGAEFFVDRLWDRFQGQSVWQWALDSLVWLGSLLLRLLIVIIGLRFFVLPLIPRVTESFSKWLFRRRFFAARPTLSIRLTEILRAVIRPIVWYIAARWIFSFFAETIQELQVLVWVIDAIFAFRVVIRILEVLSLPRWYRQQQGSASVDANDELRFSGVRRDGSKADVERGQKLLRGARPVWAVFLFAFYFPGFVELVFGITVLSNLISWLVWVPFVVWAYIVLSKWKTELSSLFYELTKDRLPKAAVFVRDNKDRWYGALIIIFAAVYVFAHEVQKLARKYLLNTEWAKRASNFAFRKQIELRTQTETQDEPKDLPTSFCDNYDIKPLPAGDSFFVDDGVCLEAIQKAFERWGKERRQGSVAILGEPGAGKTTLLNHAVERLHDWGFETTFRTVNEKRRRTSDVISFICEIFGVETSDDIETVIRRIESCDPRIVVLDDCHHFFMRQIGGFDGLETLLNIVNLTDEKHFYVLSFNSFAWSYVNRVSPRSPYFGSVQNVGPWSVEKLQEMIEKRCNDTEFTPSFSDLVVTHEGAESADFFVEVVKSSQGYFRYLHEFSRGNPSVALTYWLRSLRLADNNVLRVSLFQRPETAEIDSMSDGHWFVLTAIAQHGELRSREISQIVNLEPGFCALAVNFFEEKEVVVEDVVTGRVRLTPVFFRQVLKRLANQNFLYG